MTPREVAEQIARHLQPMPRERATIGLVWADPRQWLQIVKAGESDEVIIHLVDHDPDSLTPSTRQRFRLTVEELD